MDKITENFRRKEFACKCGCGFDDIDIRIVNRLQVVRDILGIPIKVLSGCRCKKHNADIGGKPESCHLKGEAIDWTVEDPEKLAMAAMMLVNWSGGFHYYSDKKFIHTDVGRKRRW